ncbi:hypothetical protein EMPS_04367 [Entomortierella parvispora]|uniref:Uncharacterized protein n=1 Tax=Entomortierella parvispora TaxID=205924 RepID=A0A9P3LVR3_9FUNG|nr:hypothetical protein EMPS_04367 [Entomortierella parvispora]
MSNNESILPWPSHPSAGMEVFSSTKIKPRLAAHVVAENKDENNEKLRVGLFIFDDEANAWKHTGDVFEHVWTGDWLIGDRQYHFLFNEDIPILYVITRDDNTLYALDATDHLKILAKVALPFRPASHTLSLSPSNSALYISSTFPWIVSVYDPKTLCLLGTAPSGRLDLDELSDEDRAELAATFHSPSTAIAHRRVYLDGDHRDAVVIDTPELCCISHRLAYRLSPYVDLVYSRDATERPWLLDLQTLRKVVVDLLGGRCIDLESADSSKIVFRCAYNDINRRAGTYEVPLEQLSKCLDAEGHLSEDAPTTIRFSTVTVHKSSRK